jgi:hypothetical protein
MHVLAKSKKTINKFSDLETEFAKLAETIYLLASDLAKPKDAVYL